MLNESEKNFISGIHNYCDRWCERCTFTARCSVAEAGSGLTDEERDIENGAFWRRIAANFAEAALMLKKMAEERGIDLTAVNDEEFTAHRRREKEVIKSEALTRLAENYWKDTRKTLEAKDDWLIFSALDEDAQEEMLSIIYWYQFFISAKIQRGFHGILDFDGNEDEEELNNSQSDANGSIKIALIAVERSIMAWTNLMTDENSPTIAPYISLLEIIKQKAETKFPNAQDFVRPGFDEIEIVM
jgi:hypothetical protein